MLYSVPSETYVIFCDVNSSEGREDKFTRGDSGDEDDNEEDSSDWGSDSDESSSESEAGGAVPLRCEISSIFYLHQWNLLIFIMYITGYDFAAWLFQKLL